MVVLSKEVQIVLSSKLKYKVIYFIDERTR
jgi:hypothetical protein